MEQAEEEEEDDDDDDDDRVQGEEIDEGRESLEDKDEEMTAMSPVCSFVASEVEV